MFTRNNFYIPVILMMFTSCTITKPGNVYVKQRLGKLQDKAKSEGIIWAIPSISKVLTFSTKTENIPMTLNLPSKEGLNVKTEVSVLYRINPDEIFSIITNLGSKSNYEKIVANTFRSSAADVTAEYYAKDMHSGKRSEIEKEVQILMTEILSKRGFIVEAVLLKSIELPENLYAAVQEKLRAEQDAQRMEFVLQTARQKAEQNRIEAEGIRDAQIIIQEGMTENNIAWRSLQVLENLASSPNAKIIITDGKAPVLINE